MSNPFFTNAANIVAFTRARAEVIESDSDAVAAAFDAVYTVTQRAMKTPAGEAPLNDLPSATARANKSLVFDAAGQTAVTVAATSAEMQAAITAASNAAASAAGASASAAAVAATSAAVAATVVTVTATAATAVSGSHYILDNVAATTVTLPAAPSAGDTVWITPANDLTNNVIDPGANKIRKQTGTRLTDMGLSTYQLRYLDAAKGWWLL